LCLSTADIVMTVMIERSFVVMIVIGHINIVDSSDGAFR
jgi:hypothetical protein